MAIGKNEIPINLVGGNDFTETAYSQTINFVVSDTVLIPIPTYFHIKYYNITQQGEGRLIFYSSFRRQIVLCLGNAVLMSSVIVDDTKNLTFSVVGTLKTNAGYLKYACNQLGDICLLDSNDLYFIKDSILRVITPPETHPVSIVFHQGVFIMVDSIKNQWRLSGIPDYSTFPYDDRHIGVFNEDDRLRSVYPASGRGDLIYVMGERNTQLWVKSATSTFPYSLVTSVRSSFGLYSPNTIARSADKVVWLGVDSLGNIQLTIATTQGISHFQGPGFNKFLATVSYNLQYAIGFFVVLNQVEYYVLQFDTALTVLCHLDTNQYYFLTDEKNEAHPAISTCRVLDTTLFLSKDGTIFMWDVNEGVPLPKTRITPILFLDRGSISSYDLQCLHRSSYKTSDDFISIAVSKDGNQSFKPSQTIRLSDVSRETPYIRIFANNLGVSNLCSLKINIHAQSIVLLQGKLITGV